MARVGVYAPGGSAAYPSTVLMTVIPARVAGVREVVLTTPRAGSQPLNPAVVAAAKISGVDAVYQVGGVPAIGALAYGTESIAKSTRFAGPATFSWPTPRSWSRDPWTSTASSGPPRQSSWQMTLPMPTSVPPTSSPRRSTTRWPLPSWSPIAKSWSPAVESRLETQLAAAPRGDVARQALERQGRVVLVDSLDEGVDLVNRIAPEHLCLLLAEPWDWVDRIHHAGGLFLGEYSPEVMGDYIAGPSHVMPTGGTARFGSALSVHHFLRTMPVVGLSPGDFRDLGPAAVRIANAEGLAGHAGAVQVRLDSLESTVG